MKKETYLLVGLGLGLALFVCGALAGTSRLAPALAVPSQHGSVGLGMLRPEPTDPRSAYDLTTTTVPAWQNMPPRLGSVVAPPSGQQILEPGPDDTVRVIIQLEGDPVSVHKRHLRASSAQFPELALDRIRAYDSALREEHQQLLQQIQAQGIMLQLRREYTYIFNGLAASIHVADMERIAAMPGVMAVHPDHEVHALLDDSVSLIGADQVWTMLDPYGQPVTGQGIRVAVLDTGIDYTHPDLGGCFGASCKVVGGYDFVHDDGDPMDDRGHGTHCAGIVAANGTVKGVAPDASLYAYKVLDRYGYGSDSDLLAGIEGAVNPDSDPGTDDAVDVITMSLGRTGGDPNDPVPLAVDAAVDAGVVVVAAAGNEGSGYRTVGSPALARKALAVGASDKTDDIADFSSRGPIPGFYELIKPDIVAPGVGITSTFPGGEYRSFDGTSMATPHIAGCAALIRQLHPSWSPQMIQANLMNTARDLGEDVFTQGAGRVRVNDAAHALAVLTPGSVGFGLVDVGQTMWTTSETLRLTNVSTTSLQYSLWISDTLPDGVTAHLDPASVALGAGESVTATFTITVDNRIWPYQEQAPFSCEGQVIAELAAQGQTQAQSQPGPVAVPFALLKPPIRAPGLFAPRDYSLTEDHDITFKWERVPGNYRIQIDTTWAFTSPDLISDTVTNNTYTATLGLGTWYWRVQAIDALGGESGYLYSNSFTIAEPPVQVTTDMNREYLPSITQAADGTLWAVWTSDRSGNEDIWYKTSNDRGTTWSTASQFTTDLGSDEGADITRASDGTLWVVWGSDRFGNDDLCYSSSSDAGATWSTPSQLTTDLGDGYCPAIMQLSDGTMWVVWESRRTGNPDLWYTTSSDAGATWSTASQLTTDAGWDQLPDITEAADGTVWVVWQRGGKLWHRTSSDNGVTWSAEDILDTKGATPGIARGADGTLWLVRLRQYLPFGGYYLYYSTSSDNGATWRSGWPSPWTRFVGLDYCPDLAALSDGSVAIAWGSERSVSEDVWFGIFGQHADVDPPPYVWGISEWPDDYPYSDDEVKISAAVGDETGIREVSLLWTRNGAEQSSLEMSNGYYSYYRVRLGPFPAGTQITYQVRAVDLDGNAVTAPITPVSFTVLSRPPEVGTITPSSGSGPVETTMAFTSTWLDPDGWEDLKHCYFHIGDSPSLVGNVTLLYNAKKDRLWIRSDDGSTWLGGYAPGSANVLENSQARVDCSLTTVHAAGDTIRVEWAICFKPTFTGTKKLGSKCKDVHLVRAKGEWIGTWTIRPDTTITLQQGISGYSGSEDTYIQQYAPDSNYCSQDTFKVGYKQQYAALLHFDLSSIPVDANIVEATLHMHAVGWGGSNMTVDAFRILRSTNLCQATWNQAEAGNDWGAPGCNDTVSDRGATPESSVTTCDNHVWYDFDLRSLVQEWADGTLANNGLLLRGASSLSTSMFYFASAQNDNIGLRPKLVMTYRLPSSPNTTHAAAASKQPQTDGGDSSQRWTA
jgi:hypothetical protein